MNFVFDILNENHFGQMFAFNIYIINAFVHLLYIVDNMVCGATQKIILSVPYEV